MEKHERHCTMNPARTCRWCRRTTPEQLLEQVEFLRSLDDITLTDISVLNDVVGACPACMLAALRQCGQDYHRHWQYMAQVDEWREAERGLLDRE